MCLYLTVLGHADSVSVCKVTDYRRQWPHVMFHITDDFQKFLFPKAKQNKRNKQKNPQGYTKTLLRCRSTSMRGDSVEVQTEKIMQICKKLQRKTNDSTSSRGLKIISRHIRNSPQSDTASSSIGSSRKRQTSEKDILHSTL